MGLAPSKFRNWKETKKESKAEKREISSLLVSEMQMKKN